MLISDDEIIVDSFAGGGGASCGIEAALGRKIDIAINHDPEALGMHRANHPETEHFCESVWDIDPVKVCRGRPVGVAWFSPDCKHFSKARATRRGVPVKKNIRGLAWVAVRWAATVKPRIIMLENVEEFVTWGPLRKIRDGDGNHVLDEFGQFTYEACPLRKGMTFKSFVRALEKRGYQVEWKELRACDYGAPTIRKRLFMIARCDGLPIIWPEATHGDGLLPKKSAAECIDWTIETPSIFTRKKPLVEKTMIRIARGIKRYVMDCDDPFVAPLNASAFLTEHANGSSQRNFNIQEPLRTQCAQVKGGHFALVNAFIIKHFGGVTGTDIRKPFPTVMTRGTQNQLCTSSVMKMRGTNIGHDVREPLHTISAGGLHHAEVRAFLIKYFGVIGNQGLNEAMHTVTTKDRFGLVTIKGEAYQIIDIGMRMLSPRELYKAQSFPDNYIITHTADGKKLTKTAQVRMCGNSVPPVMAKVLITANNYNQMEENKNVNSNI